MRASTTAFVLLALAATASARLQASNTTTNTPTPMPLSTRGICLFGCSTRTLDLYCRCSAGCAFSLGYYRATDVDPSKSHCSNGAYNKGDWCSITGRLRFNRRWSVTIENRSYRLNGYKIGVGTHSDYTEHRLQGSRGANRCSYY